MGSLNRTKENRRTKGRIAPPRFLSNNARVLSARRARQTDEEAVRLAELDDLEDLLDDPFTDESHHGTDWHVDPTTVSATQQGEVNRGR